MKIYSNKEIKEQLLKLFTKQNIINYLKRNSVSILGFSFFALFLFISVQFIIMPQLYLNKEILIHLTIIQLFGYVVLMFSFILLLAGYMIFKVFSGIDDYNSKTKEEQK